MLRNPGDRTRTGLWSRLMRRGPDGERGAILVLASVATVTALAAAGLAVDVGYLVTTKRNLQAVVDLAALDSARAYGDLLGQAADAAAYAGQLASESLARNGFDPDDAALGHVVTVQPGQYDPDTRQFPVAQSPTTWPAVKVTVNATQGWHFSPGTKNYSASAVAAVHSQAGIAAGSFLVRVDSQDSILDPLLSALLGGSVNLDLVSYQGLVDAEVTLAELGTQLGVSVGTPDQVLAADVTLFQVLDATADALSAQGNVFAAQVAGMALAVNNSTHFTLGSLIDLAQGTGGEALSAGINVAQLIQGSAQIANKNHLVTASLPLLGVSGLATAAVDVTVIEAPQIAIGPAAQVGGAWVTRVETAQIRAKLKVTLLGSIQVPITLEAAQAEAALTGLHCATLSNPGPDQLTTNTTTHGLTAALGPIGLPLGFLGALINVSSNASLAGYTEGHKYFANFDWDNKDQVPDNHVNDLDYPDSDPSSQTATLITSLTSNITATLLGISFKVAATAVLQPVFNLLGVLLKPLMESLGLIVGGADVWGWDLDCNLRTLVD